MSPSVAIVILNFNGEIFLQKFLPSVLSSNYVNKRIIVADNHSTDRSIEILEKEFPTVEIIRLVENYGFAGGYNKALAQIKSDYYVLLNSDVEVTTNWISPIIKLMENDRTIAACQPKILSYNNKSQFEFAGAAGGYIDKLGYPFARGRLFDDLESDKMQYDDYQPIFWASGAALFIRSSVYHTTGGLDAYFFAHQEEIDLCWRIQRNGYKIYYCGASTVYHVGGGTLNKSNPRKTYLNFRNNLIMLSKNLRGWDKFKIIPLRLVLDGVFAVKQLVSGDLKTVKAIFNAHIGYYKWCFRANKEPDNLNKPRFLSLSGVVDKSIVWQYFVRNIKNTKFLLDK